MRRNPRQSGFTLIEILVVLAILGILMGIGFKSGAHVVVLGRTRYTEATLSTLNQAVLTYKSDSNQSRIPNVRRIFGDAPPDNIYVFDGQNSGITLGGLTSPKKNICMARSSSSIGPATGTSSGDELIDKRNSSGELENLQAWRHGDMRALVLAIRLRSPKASVLLDRIDPSFLVVDEEYVFTPDVKASNPETIALNYYTDAWGTPIEYYSAKIGDPKGTLTPREVASNAFVRANAGDPLFVSYGPNGEEQFSAETMADTGDTSIVADYWRDDADTGGSDGDYLINGAMNDDNLYSSDTFKNRMAQREKKN